MRKLALILLSIQVFGVALVVFGDIGFDKPGKLGLDYNALLFIVAMELGLFLTLMAVSVLNKKWWPALSSAIIVSSGAYYAFRFL